MHCICRPSQLSTGHDGEQEQQAHDLHGDLCSLVFIELLLQSVIQIIKPRAVGPSALESAWSVIDCNPEALESHWKSWKRWTRSIRKTWGLGSLHADVFPEEVKLRVWEPLGGTCFADGLGFFRLSLPKLNMDPPPKKSVQKESPIPCQFSFRAKRVLSYWHR